MSNHSFPVSDSRNKTILSQSELTAIWERAQRASRDRHVARRRGDFGAAARFSVTKIALAVQVFRFAPATAVDVRLQWWKTNLLVSVTFAGVSLHLPYHCAPLFGLGTREAQPNSSRYPPSAHMRPHRGDTISGRRRAQRILPQWRDSVRTWGGPD
jgi:hypothetical protein